MENKICLYLIGYEKDAHYVPALIESVKNAVDCVFYLNTDDSVQTVKALENECKKHNISFSYFYKSEWPDGFHFGKARNKAKEIAEQTFSCNWFLWLDLDDVLINPEQLRELAKDETVQAWHFEYKVHGTGYFTRERMTRRGVGTWVNRVHEILKIPQDTPQAIAKGIHVLHTKETKNDPSEKSSHDLHIELCKKEIENAPNYYLYIGKEYFNSQRPVEAKKWFTMGLAMTECPLEKYNTLIYLSKIAGFEKDINTQRFYLKQAFEENPSRRESLYYLAVIETTSGKHERALAFIRACCALPKPSTPMLEESLYDGAEPLVLFYRLLARLMQYNESFEVAKTYIESQQQKGDIEMEILREAKILTMLIEEESTEG